LFDKENAKSLVELSDVLMNNPINYSKKNIFFFFNLFSSLTCYDTIQFEYTNVHVLPMRELSSEYFYVLPMFHETELLSIFDH
jgi:hypothetical protein